MKKFLLSLVSASFIGVCGYASDFSVDGLNYTLLSATDQTCALSAGDYKGELVIPDEVTFKGRNLKVVSVEDEAIENLPELTSCKIGKNVTQIGKYAFNNTPELMELVIPPNVTEIKEFSFRNCGIRKLVIEASDDLIKLGVSEFTTIKGQFSTPPFNMCQNLEEVYFGRPYVQLKGDGYSVYKSLFYGNATIKKVTLGSHVNMLGGARYQ